MAKETTADTPAKAHQTSLELENAYYNKGLFADNFLDKRIFEIKEWQSLSEQHLKQVFDAVLKIYQQHAVKFNDDTKEAVTEDDFIKPVLNVLWNEPNGGKCYQIQQDIPFHGSQDRRIPDYVFFESAENRSLADQQAGTQAYWTSAIALGDAKRWNLSLDKMRGQENPSGQITNYLYRAKVRWGILTNGVKWRLYEEDKSRGGSIYFEVDLEQILQNQDLNGFRWFYMFFSKQSFLPEDGRKSFVEQVLLGSAQYASSVSDHLKESVYDALRAVMNGICAETGNKVDPADPEQLKRVHEIALIILYRLLFLMYAEDRKLLPVDTKPYQDMSLRTIHREINRKLRASESYYSGAFQLWAKLRGLWEIIDSGLSDKGKWLIPAYNGGLFSPEHFPEIPHAGANPPGAWRIGDSFLADAIDMLAYTREAWNQPGSADIDYATLDVRHLGSIYEGLLELRPEVADVDLVEVWDGKKLAFSPVAEGAGPGKKVKGQEPRRIEAGEVYLVTDRGERKATGSYYTPAYIVNYIVEHTVGPLAQEARLKAEALFGEVVGEIGRINKLLQEKAGNVVEVKKLTAELRQARQRILAPYLNLKILDPAMGSGHFLVGAADFLSREMAFDPAIEAVYEDAGLENAQAYFKRLVVEHCLYGVDLNPLAVELAKLSLWLHTVSRDKALSFLDHHLRCGNSLIGARIEDDLAFMPPSTDPKARKKAQARSALERQIGGFSDALQGKDLAYLLEYLADILALPTETAADEHQKQEIYAKLDAVRQKYWQVANLWLAPFFGVEVTDANYSAAVAALKGTGDKWQQLSAVEWFAQAQAVAAGKRFFHWELAFPEVFFESLVEGQAGFKPKDKRGFDAVIGNPPYGDILDTDEKEALAYSGYRSGGSGNNDVFRFFTEKSLALCSDERFSSLIIPNTCLSGSKYGNYRRAISSMAYIKEILDFRLYKNFEADVFTMIIIYYKLYPKQVYNTTYLESNEGIITESIGRDLMISPDTSENWLPLNSIYSRLIREGKAVRLDIIAESMDVGINYQRKDVGWQNRAVSRIAERVFYEGTRQHPKDFPYLKGEDIERFCSSFRDRWLRHDYLSGIENNESISVNHAAAILPEKILSRQTGDCIIAAIDRDSFYTGRSLHTTKLIDLEYSTEFIVAILNSRLVTYIYRSLSLEEGRALAQVNLANVRRLPIPAIAFNTPTDERGRLSEQAQRLSLEYLQSGVEAGVMAIVTRCLSPLVNISDIVHDLLAFLAEEMTRLHKEKQGHIREFLGWLSDSALAGQDLNAIDGKTKLLEYHKHGVADLIAVLKQGKNKKLLAARKVDPEAAAFHARLKAEHEASLAKLTPLFKQIALTDKLIDQIVYKLYGLTEEEIAIVEGTASIEAPQSDQVMEVVEEESKDVSISKEAKADDKLDLLYFAYGSNMKKQRMDNRCSGSKYLTSYTLQGYRLKFAYNSKSTDKTGKANIVQEDGHSVQGVIYRISEEHRDDLTAVEVMYHREDNLFEFQGQPVMSFIMDSDGLKEAKPTEEYCGFILDGYEHWSLDPRQTPGLEPCLGVDRGNGD